MTDAPRPAVGSVATARTVPTALATATVLAHVAYPLTEGVVRHRLTLGTVLVFAAASLSHTLLWRGPRVAGVLLVAAGGIGLVVEVVGTATGVPFGTYAYAETLGPRVAGVPAVIPLAWVMMSYPAAVVGRRISPHPLGAIVAGAVALTAWDVFLDPQMVAEGHWSWAGAVGPRVLGIPLSNFAGWFATGLAIMALLVPALRRAERRSGPAPDGLPLALYVWVWASSTLAHAAFLDLPGSARVGGVGMGLVVAFLAWQGRRR